MRSEVRVLHRPPDPKRPPIGHPTLADKTKYVGASIAIGAGLGAAIGVALDMLAVGIAVGIAVGAGIGYIYSQRGD